MHGATVLQLEIKKTCTNFIYIWCNNITFNGLLKQHPSTYLSEVVGDGGQVMQHGGHQESS